MLSQLSSAWYEPVWSCWSTCTGWRRICVFIKYIQNRLKVYILFLLVAFYIVYMIYWSHFRVSFDLQCVRCCRDAIQYSFYLFRGGPEGTNTGGRDAIIHKTSTTCLEKALLQLVAVLKLSTRCHCTPVKLVLFIRFKMRDIRDEIIWFLSDWCHW